MSRPPLPPIRFPLASPDLGRLEEASVLRALRAGHVSGASPEIARFEGALTDTAAARHAVATSSGTAALHLALVALGVGPGDEVIVPDLTYVAAANVVRYVGASPVLVDIDPRTWTLDPDAAEQAVGKRTRAIIAVHLYGNPADLGRLRRLARQARVALVEDGAEALGAAWRGRPIGGFGDVGCFSFFGNKVVTTGEGGAVVTGSAAMARRLRALRDQAKSGRRPYFHHELGFSYRMSALQAALGTAQLERLSGFLARRDAIRAWYRAELAAVEGWSEPEEYPGATAVNWLHVGLVQGWTRQCRDRCLRLLRQQGIDARPVFVPMSSLPEFRSEGGPHARQVSGAGLCLPVGTRMMRRDVQAIARAFREAVRVVGG